MNRRDFLLLRAGHQGRMAELSCERLYMRYVDSRRTTDEPLPADYETWMGEPPLVRDTRDLRTLFSEIDRELEDVLVLRVVNSEWVQCEGLRHEFEGLLQSFRARGGTVTYVRSGPEPRSARV